MRALGLSDTIFYNLRDGYLTAVSILEGPCDLPLFAAQIEGAVETAPGWRERPFRLGIWSFATAPRAIDLRDHIFVARDPGVTAPADVARLLDRLRRSRFSSAGPPWRTIVLNPAGTPPEEPGAPAPLSCVFMQMRHGLADAARALQAMATMAGFTPAGTHRDIAGGLRDFDFGDLPGDMTIHDSGPWIRKIARSRVARSGDPAADLARTAAAAVHDSALYPDVAPLTGTLGCTRLVRRRGAERGVGNHVRLEAIGDSDMAAAKAIRIPGLERAQNLPVMQVMVAMAPGPLARTMMRIWYGSFDVIATLLPLPALSMGGQRVTTFYATPPLWGPVPLAVMGLVDRDNWHLLALPGRGFGGDGEALMDRLEGELTGGG